MLDLLSLAEEVRDSPAYQEYCEAERDLLDMGVVETYTESLRKVDPGGDPEEVARAMQEARANLEVQHPGYEEKRKVVEAALQRVRRSIAYQTLIDCMKRCLLAESLMGTAYPEPQN